MAGISVILCTVPSHKVGTDIAGTLVTKRLAACVNIMPGLTSIYEWEGKLENEAEFLLIVKTSDDRIPDLVRKIEEIHPYDVPEIIALPVNSGSEPYIKWVINSVNDEPATEA
jgi:periplasmic divalent cation tolerance protein